MIAIITGDIINSRKEKPAKWQPLLKNILNKYGKDPKDWEMYRGDSFQLKVNPENAFLAAIHIKSSIKQIANLDVRMAIGIGNIEKKTKKITQSTGNAFIRSGESFDILKRQTLLLATGNAELDETLNLMISLALLTANNWSRTVASIILTCIEKPEKTQREIALLLKKTQSSISEALKRGGFDEIKKLNQYYQEKVAQL
ncbi:SatD family protein [Niabella insulamsoli]|uniref:SatD family protein n=1 Tax=Niabella insulamsoli TaxID=3144874 RepID=UPI0031FBA4AE